MLKGIDLSEYNQNLDYKALKQSGIEFAIIRCGYGKDAGQKDKLFETHYKGCKEAGIKVGAYHYSYCTSSENALKEADNCLSYIKDKSFDLPIFYDLEENRIASLGKNTVNEIAVRFCKRIESAGYRSGVYANLNWFKNYIDPYVLIDNNIKIWLAQWNSTMTATFKVDLWQFTNQLNVAGKNFDGDYLLNEDLLNNDPDNETFDVNIDYSLAVSVIFGEYGNGQERKERLGSHYNAVQDIVNEIYKICRGE